MALELQNRNLHLTYLKKREVFSSSTQNQYFIVPYDDDVLWFFFLFFFSFFSYVHSTLEFCKCSSEGKLYNDLKGG